MPFEQEVATPEDDAPSARMWFVLHEYPNDPRRGQSIALDPDANEWMLVEPAGEDGWSCDTIGGRTLPQALAGM